MKTSEKFNKLLQKQKLFMIQSTPCSKHKLKACIFLAMEEINYPCDTFTQAIDWLYEQLEEKFI